jgi:hypothetical protein
MELKNMSPEELISYSNKMRPPDRRPRINYEPVTLLSFAKIPSKIAPITLTI